jgi:hypothetical protein
MRKKLFAVLSIVTILAMESVTVFAVPSETTATSETNEENNVPTAQPATQPTLSGAITTDTATVEIAEVTQEQLTQVDEKITATLAISEPEKHDDGSKTYTVESSQTDDSGNAKSVSVTASEDGKTFTAVTDSGTKLEIKLTTDSTKPTYESSDNKEKLDIIPQNDNVQYQEMSEKTIATVTAKIAMVMDEIVQSQNNEASSVVFFDITFTPNENGELKIKVGNGKEGDPYYIIHFMDNGEWEYEYCETDANGELTSKPTGQSPFIIIKLDKRISTSTTATDSTYAQPSSSLTNGQVGTTSTVSGDISPKTGESYPYAATVMVAALACIFACTKKLAKK